MRNKICVTRANILYRRKKENKIFKKGERQRKREREKG